jgi:uncharacterized protein YdaU (DUF1376 family)
MTYPTSMERAAAHPLGGMTYARFFPSDWRTGCLCLNLEEEGLYIRFCAYMYDTGSAPPDDDKITSRLLNVHILQYRKVMASLVAKGKIIRAQGILINERVQEEIDRYRREYVARVRAAKEREAKRRQIAQELEADLAAKRANPRVNPPVNPGVNPRVNPGVTPIPSLGLPTQSTTKLSNEINDTPTTAVAQPDHDCGTNPESRIQKPEKKEIIPTTNVEVDAAGGSSGYLDELNGTAVDLIAFIGRHARVDEQTAQRMLTTNIKTFTAPAMLEAFSITLADMAGGLISAPYKYLIGAARNAKERMAKKAAAVPKQSRADRLMRLVEEKTAQRTTR